MNDSPQARPSFAQIAQQMHPDVTGCIEFKIRYGGSNTRDSNYVAVPRSSLLFPAAVLVVICAVAVVFQFYQRGAISGMRKKS